MTLVDTDIMIDILREYPPAIAWLQSLGDERVVVPGYVFMELIQGCKNKTEQRKIEQLLAYDAVVWPTPQTCQNALLVFSRYHLSHNLGLLDALIGATATASGESLYTFNQKHYDMIPGLKTVQPYTK